MLTAKHLYTAIVIAILAFVAFKFVERWANRLGRETAYAVRLEECKQTYPPFRCVIELAREFPEINR